MQALTFPRNVASRGCATHSWGSHVWAGYDGSLVVTVTTRRRGAHDRAVASGAGGPAGPPAHAAGGGGRLPAGVGERELPQVRQAELRVRRPGPSRARAAVPVDPEPGPP